MLDAGEMGRSKNLSTTQIAMTRQLGHCISEIKRPKFTLMFFMQKWIGNSFVN